MGIYWTFNFLAWATLASFFAWRARRHGLPRMVGVDVFLLSLPLVFLGTRLFSIVDVDGLGSKLDVASFLTTRGGWTAGHTSFGAVLGALATFYVAARLHRTRTLLLVDLAAPGIFLASPIGRTGCFMTGCCFGAPTDVPWGVRFPIDHLFATHTLPSHPTQLYEIAVGLVIFALLPALFARLGWRPGPGLIGFASIGLYLAERFVLELFRIGGTSTVWRFHMSMAQVVSLSGITLCALLLAWGLTSGEKKPRRSHGESRTPEPAGAP